MKLRIYDFIFWGLLIYCSIGMAFSLRTLQKWKWGYYSIDMIPYLIILILLGCYHYIKWISKIDKRVEVLENLK